MTRKTLNLLGCLVMLTASAAFAADDEETETELVEKVAVRNRLFSVENRFELGGNVGFSLLTRLTDHYNFNISAAYNFKDWLGLELRAGYAYSRHTSLADQIQSDYAANGNSKIANDAADLWEMTGNAVLGLRFQPVYGKINLLAELPIHFQLYLWVGGGAALLKQESLVLCSQRGSSGCDAFYTQNKVSPLVSLALGFRFFVIGGHSIKIEARDYSYLDSYWVNVTRKTGSTNNTFSSDDQIRAAGGMQSTNAGITNLVQFDLGYAFVF